MRIRWGLMILMSLLICTACNHSNEQMGYDPDLLSYMVSEPARYYGEGQYYHEIQKIESTALDKQYRIEASGEIKDTSIGKTYIDYAFNYQFLITDQMILQTLNNNRLNDSDFKEIELLRLPLEVGHTWTFNAVMFNDKTVKMTAEIFEVNDTSDEIKVRYTANGYVETRFFKKKFGVTDFIKEVAYKDVKAISGFHLEEGKKIGLPRSESKIKENSNEENAFADINEVNVTPVEHDLILGFNQNYEKKIKLETDNLLDYIMPESPASEKIDNLKFVDVGTFNFMKFKVKSKTTVGDLSTIEVVELYDLGNDQSILNTVTYTLKIYGDQLMIYDFE
ncbi:hypothetical protein [Fusibacter sp. 3D3]|uniref:hypothetical protein n=1 Tax=Fusibacter sp. 3D3 TaxID=1048380 RepID=UPI000853B868|nr:hypothetical protein [Fusibacter sp. 3D3]GAU77357.1 hypothetical protein F3D3_1984 [Fusibacter sp. 3D3]